MSQTRRQQSTDGPRTSLVPWRLTLITAMVVMTTTGTSCADETAAVLPPHDEIQIESGILGETRHINVFVPEGQTPDAAPLPVLYMPDGGIREDFPHIVETIRELIASHRIAPTIVVGIENTERRRDLTGPTSIDSDRRIAPHVGGSEEFRAFIREELIPVVEKRYRCTSQRAIVGESLAGLFVIETMLLEPDLFDRYIAMDPSLWWNNHELVDERHLSALARSEHPKRLWFASSNATDITPHARKLSELITTEAFPHVERTYVPMPDEEHSTIFRAAKAQAFAWSLWKQ